MPLMIRNGMVNMMINNDYCSGNNRDTFRLNNVFHISSVYIKSSNWQLSERHTPKRSILAPHKHIKHP